MAGKRKKGAWMEAVGQVLRQYIGGEELNLEGEGLETMIARLAKCVYSLHSTRSPLTYCPS